MVHHEKLSKGVGYSFDTEASRLAWRSKVEGFLDFIRANDLHDKVVFHGTSTKAVEEIRQSGLRPSSVGIALGVDCFADGSFWGDILTAVSFAEDTAKERHPGYLPAVLAISVASLAELADLEPDGATVDFPNPGLTLLDDPHVEAKWARSFNAMSWRDSLTDLGAVVAVHDEVIDFDRMIVLDVVDDLIPLIASRKIDAPRPVCL